MAKRTGTVLEIDAYPERLDINDEIVKKCVEAEVKMSIDSDAYAADHLSYLRSALLKPAAAIFDGMDDRCLLGGG